MSSANEIFPPIVWSMIISRAAVQERKKMRMVCQSMKEEVEKSFKRQKKLWIRNKDCNEIANCFDSDHSVSVNDSLTMVSVPSVAQLRSLAKLFPRLEVLKFDSPFGRVFLDNKHNYVDCDGEEYPIFQVFPSVSCFIGRGYIGCGQLSKTKKLKHLLAISVVGDLKKVPKKPHFTLDSLELDQLTEPESNLRSSNLYFVCSPQKRFVVRGNYACGLYWLQPSLEVLEAAMNFTSYDLVSRPFAFLRSLHILVPNNNNSDRYLMLGIPGRTISDFLQDHVNVIKDFSFPIDGINVPEFQTFQQSLPNVSPLDVRIDFGFLSRKWMQQQRGGNPDENPERVPYLKTLYPNFPDFAKTVYFSFPKHCSKSYLFLVPLIAQNLMSGRVKKVVRERIHPYEMKEWTRILADYPDIQVTTKESNFYESQFRDIVIEMRKDN